MQPIELVWIDPDIRMSLETLIGFPGENIVEIDTTGNSKPWEMTVIEVEEDLSFSWSYTVKLMVDQVCKENIVDFSNSLPMLLLDWIKGHVILNIGLIWTHDHE